MTSINVCNFIIFWLVLFSDCCLPAIWFLCWLVGSWCSHLWDVSWAGQLHPTSYWILNLPNRFNSRLLIKWIIQCILKQLLAGWVVYQTKGAFQKSELAGRTVTGPVILTKHKLFPRVVTEHPSPLCILFRSWLMWLDSFDKEWDSHCDGVGLAGQF